MEYQLDNRVVLSTERKHENLYSWSIKEFDNRETQIGVDQIPWDWSLYFEVVELFPVFKIEMRAASNDHPEASTESSEYLSGKLRPTVESRQAGHYSMFGTQRPITEFGLLVHKAKDEKDKCHLWGSISYTADFDFQDVTEPDCVFLYVYLSAVRFDQLMNFVKFPRPTRAQIRLTGVSGFYSEWSPSIRTDRIKILANAADQRLENPQRLGLSPPVLGGVKEFDLTMQQEYPFPPKRS
jgi:hypothetical protein